MATGLLKSYITGKYFEKRKTRPTENQNTVQAKWGPYLAGRGDSPFCSPSSSMPLVTTPQEWRPAGIRLAIPSFHLHLWVAKNAYADDLAIVHAGDLRVVEGVLSNDVATIGKC